MDLLSFSLLVDDNLISTYCNCTKESSLLMIENQQKCQTSVSNFEKNQSPRILFSWSFGLFYSLGYSIVKDSSADLGVNFKIVQNRPTVKAVCTKISKKFFLHICQYFYISERK